MVAAVVLRYKPSSWHRAGLTTHLPSEERVRLAQGTKMGQSLRSGSGGWASAVWTSSRGVARRGWEEEENVMVSKGLQGVQECGVGG